MQRGNIDSLAPVLVVQQHQGPAVSYFDNLHPLEPPRRSLKVKFAKPEMFAGGILIAWPQFWWSNNIKGELSAVFDDLSPLEPPRSSVRVKFVRPKKMFLGGILIDSPHFWWSSGGQLSAICDVLHPVEPPRGLFICFLFCSVLFCLALFI